MIQTTKEGIMVIRYAAEQDTEKIYTLLNEVYGEEYLNQYKEGWLEELIENEENIIFVVEEAEKIEACIGIAVYVDGKIKK